MTVGASETAHATATVASTERHDPDHSSTDTTADVDAEAEAEADAALSTLPWDEGPEVWQLDGLETQLTALGFGLATVAGE